MPSVSLENHFYPPGTEFEIPGLGVVKNFEPTEVDEVQVGDFVNRGFEFPEDGNLKLVIQEHVDISDELEPETGLPVEDSPKDGPLPLLDEEGDPQ